MRFDPPKSIRSVIEEYLDRFPQKRKLRQGMVLAAWREVVGDRIADQTEDLHFEGNKLAMRVKHPTWRHEIHANRFSISKRLNKKLNADIVKDLIVRA
ncbi:MAG: DUF721 domain-containing protein [Bacteroidota bacterium]